MNEPLAIFHMHHHDRMVSGSVVQLADAAFGLAARGHLVTVGSRAGGELEDACAARGVDFLPLNLSSSFDLRSALALRRRLRSRPPDLVHVHKGRSHSLALQASAGLGSRPVLVVNRGVSFPLDRFNRWKYRHPRVGAVVCVAEAVRQAVLATSALPPERVHTVHGGTDSRCFDPARVDGSVVRDELGIEESQAVIGQVSVRDWKGWQQLMAAFIDLRSTAAESRLLFVGCETRGDRQKLETAAQLTGITDAVHILPYRRDMPEVLAACDVVVDASVAGTGITGTIREAMALSRAVVATHCGGNRELVASDEVGLLVPPDDVPALAAALGGLLADRELRDRLGRAARRRVMAGFTTEHRLDRLEALYRSVLTQ